MWTPASYYPDPAVEILDPSFMRYRVTLAAVEQLATGLRWAEGPVWCGDARHLLVSDIPNNRIVKWDEETGLAQHLTGDRATTPTEIRGIGKGGW